MLMENFRHKHYSSAADRFFKPTIVNFFTREFPSLFGPVIRENIANELIAIFEKMNPDVQKITHGQIFWNALDKNTRAGSPKRKYIPVVLTLVSPADIKDLLKGEKIGIIRENAVARVIKEAYVQGGILSMRDVGLMFNMADSAVSTSRKNYEKKHNIILPHAGSLHDMGSCITHKVEIVHKVVVEKKDPTQAAYETNHSQRAVDRYLVDFHRVHTLYKNNHDIDFIHTVTNIAKNVVVQYIDIIEKYVKEHEK